MAEGTPEAAARPEETSLVMRALRAIELLVSAHARIARLEAKNDAARVVSGVFFAGIALVLLSFAGILGHVMAVLAIDARLGCGVPTSLAAVAGADVALALACLLVARARLHAPVMVETRAMMTKAASTLRG